MESNVTPADFGTGPQGTVLRWMKEYDLASKAEKDWRSCADGIWDKYRGKNRRRNSFNILWSNTETLAPALYNSAPKPDVRRRFKDADPIGKAVSQMLERCLEFQTDTGNFADAIKLDVLDMLLPGRGLSRVKYVPSFAPGEKKEPVDGKEQESEDTLAWEQCEIEHVQWDKFRRGPGKTWPEVCWISFDHDMTKEMVTDLAGKELADKLTYSPADDEDLKKDDSLQEVFGTVRIVEFWCKDDRKVLFIAPSYKNAPVLEEEDPLKLNNFYPIPRPLYAISDSSSLVPLPMFEQYKEQAEELNRISVRINKIVDALKVRGLYDSTLAELGQLMKVDDNQLTPVQNAAMWAEKGGLEKAIWMMPIEPAANVLKVLYEQRDKSKQVIYEITGIADVMRGTSDPNETLGAQKLKAKFGSQRITNLQLEIQRYARDIILLMSEIISEKFQPETLLRMSQMQLPTEEQVNAQLQQLQMQAAQAQQQGQPPQPLPPRPVTIEKVVEVLRDDATRMFKIDVETDSMIAATLEDDMQGLRDVIGGVSQFINEIGPAVQMGAFPVEAVKEIVMTICRRSKLGSAVEDSLEQIKAPNPQGNPEQAKAQAAQQAAQMKAQTDQQIAQMKVQSDGQIEQIRAQAKIQIETAAQQAQQQTDMVRQQAEAAQHTQKLEMDARFEQMQSMFDNEKHAREQDFLRWKAELDAATKIEVANISSKAKIEDAATKAATSEISSEVTQ